MKWPWIDRKWYDIEREARQAQAAIVASLEAQLDRGRAAHERTIATAEATERELRVQISRFMDARDEATLRAMKAEERYHDLATRVVAPPVQPSPPVVQSDPDVAALRKLSEETEDNAAKHLQAMVPGMSLESARAEARNLLKAADELAFGL